jgi:hypothetical protein
MQLIKGGFSFRAKRELGFVHENWQVELLRPSGQIRDVEEFLAYSEYICQNPVKKGLVHVAEDYVSGSAWPGYQLDEAPQRLKPVHFLACPHPP